MDVEKIKKMLRKHDGLSNTLGMEFISTPEPDTCKATMKVDERNKQAFGFAVGRLQSKGNTLHVWHIDITNSAGELISTVQVTNYIMKSSAPKV